MMGCLSLPGSVTTRHVCRVCTYFLYLLVLSVISVFFFGSHRNITSVVLCNGKIYSISFFLFPRLFRRGYSSFFLLRLFARG